jgi:hypothetical protein
MEITGVTYSTTHYEHYNQNGDRNYFEEVIDKMILDGIAGMNETFRNAIMSLDRDKKRMTILSLLDKDLNLFKRIKALTDKNIGKMDHIKDIILMLREYVKVGEVEKKKFGEVMTPLELVKEMLATLPEEVWSNPNLKWLDPANGTGPYPIMVIYKLMNGLVEWEPDAEKRYKHIVENMIYVCELQPKNMFLYMCAIDPFDAYKLNIYTGSFLEEGFDYHMKNVWGLDKFDIVMGNPPYQEQKPGFRKTQPLWNLFVEKGLSLLKENGYLSLVHPDTWRGLGDGFKQVGRLLKSKDILYLKVHDRTKGVEFFGAQTSFDFYCLRNSSSKNHKTKVDFLDNTSLEININDISFIPNGLYELFSKLIAKNGEERVNILSGSNYHTQREELMSKERSIKFKYPCIYTILKDGKVNLWYSNTDKNGHFGIPKVVWTNGTSLPTVDDDGSFGLTQFAYAIIDDVENLELIKSAMLNKKFIELMSFSQGIKHRYNKNIIESFRKDFWKEFI